MTARAIAHVRRDRLAPNGGLRRRRERPSHGVAVVVGDDLALWRATRGAWPPSRLTVPLTAADSAPPALTFAVLAGVVLSAMLTTLAVAA